MPQDMTPAGPTPADVANAKQLTQVVGQIASALGNGSTTISGVLASIAAAITSSIIGGTTGVNANRALVSKGTGGFALQPTPVTIDPGTGNVSGVRDLSATSISSPVASTTAAGVIEEGTVAEVRSAATGTKAVTTELLETAAAAVTLTPSAGTISLDWDAGINFEATLSQASTLANPTNGQPGTWRTILIIENGTGGWTLGFGGQFVFPSGVAPVITTSANANNRLSIFCRTTSIYELYGVGIGLA